MRVKYFVLILLTALASVEAAAQDAKGADGHYKVVKEVRSSDGSPSWTVIYSGLSAWQDIPSMPKMRYTLQYKGGCYQSSEESCNYPLSVGQILNRHNIVAKSGTIVWVNDDSGTFEVTYLNRKNFNAIYKIVRVEVVQDAEPAQSTSAPPSRKDIPTIAKAANGAIVTVVMANNDKPFAQGTGFLVSADGMIVTNYHVIETGNVAVVKFSDGNVLPVDGVLAADKVRDLAVIKVHGKRFQTLNLGDSDKIQVGENVVAIGDSLGLELTVSNGIVSGKRTDEKLGGKFIQITAPISHGNSGGPLFNMFGEVIGINSMFLEGGENLNFAIPINDAKSLLENQSAVLQNLPNQIEPAAPSAAPAATPAAPPDPNTPSLETSVEFMKRMAEPEHHDILPGELSGAEFSTKCGASLTVVAYDKMYGGFVTGTSEKNGYPAYTYDIIGEYKEESYPRYTSFCLKDIDPTSIDSVEAGLDVSALSEFWNKHPECKSTQCMNEYLKSGAKLTAVRFHTTDLKPLIERGGFEGQSTCSNDEKTSGGVGCKMAPKHTETVVGAMIFFRDKSRAQRFVTALVYAVKSQGGQADMFPPTR